MKAARLFAYFIIFLMVASSLAFVWEFYNKNGQDSGEELPPESPPVPLAYASEEIDANVIEIFPTITLTAKTNEVYIDKIDALVYDANGVSRIAQSKYRNPTERSEFSLLYIAEISYNAEYSPAEVIENIEKSASSALNSIEAALSGLVAIPSEVELSNADLNITKAHKFDRPLSNAYISIDSLKGDELKVTLNVTLSGEALVGIQAFETKNLTAEAIPLSLEGKYALSELDKRIVIYGDVNYSFLPDGNALKAELLGISGVNEADVEIFEPYKRISLDIYDANAPSRQQDLNAAFSSISGITNFFFVPADENRLYAAIDFNDAQPFVQLKNEILSRISAFGISEGAITLKEPSASLNIDLNTSTEQTAEINSSLKTLSGQKSISSTIYQTGKSNINVLTIPDTNASYTIDANYLPLFAVPGHSAGDEIELKIDFYGKRSKAIAIRAVEKT